MSFLELLCETVPIAFDRQLSIAEQVGDWRWDLDERAGTMTFSRRRFLRTEKRTTAIQILGSESRVSDTWLWSWANEVNGDPPALLRAAREMRALGEERGFDVLTHGEFSLEAADGHLLAAVAVGALDAAGYWACPYGDGTAFVLLMDRSFIVEPASRCLRVAQVFPQFLMTNSFEDPSPALRGYCKRLGLEVDQAGDRAIRAADKQTGEAIEARFDEAGRLLEISCPVRGRRAS